MASGGPTDPTGRSELPEFPRVAILICTCDRPHLLKSLLDALAQIVARCSWNVVSIIIDNGKTSAQDVIESFRDRIQIDYQRLAVAGVVAPRNASLKRALAHHPDVLAFIDDDEIPSDGWLLELVGALQGGADFATGPVRPRFDGPAPSWAEDFFSKSGNTYCTSNLILRASILPACEDDWFQPAFNFTGGEDNEFLNRLARGGAGHAVAHAAEVTELIPHSRLSLSYVWSHGLRDGTVEAQKLALSERNVLKRTALILGRFGQKLGYAINHLFWSPASPARFARALDDAAAASGLLLRSLGVTFVFYGRR